MKIHLIWLLKSEVVKLVESSWFQQGLSGIEKGDSYSALMGFDGAIVREIQTGQKKNALTGLFQEALYL